MASEQDDKPGWHLKREIQLGHIITTMTVAISVVVYVGKIEQRVALLEASNTTQHERDERQDRAMSEALAQISTRLTRIEDLLYRAVEAQRAKR